MRFLFFFLVFPKGNLGQGVSNPWRHAEVGGASCVGMGNQEMISRATQIPEIILIIIRTAAIRSERLQRRRRAIPNEQKQYVSSELRAGG